MSDVRTVVILTTIRPDPTNRGGPSGLPWEIVEELRATGIDVSVEIVPTPRNRLVRRLRQLAIAATSAEVSNKDADVYIVYPLNACRLVPVALRKRTLVLGPDSAAMLYARFARIMHGLHRLRALLLSRWFASLEVSVARSYGGLAVVGRNDARWIRQRLDMTTKNRVHFIPHPQLRSVAIQDTSNDSNAGPRLVFSGDLSAKYVGSFFADLDLDLVNQTLATHSGEVLVVGKHNRAVYERLRSRLPTRYEEWVADYATICHPFRDVHAIPLFAGAGTKNRTLTAIAMKVVILSTRIGTENIAANIIRTAKIHRFQSAFDFNETLMHALADLRQRRQNAQLPDTNALQTLARTFAAALHSSLVSVNNRNISSRT